MRLIARLSLSLAVTTAFALPAMAADYDPPIYVEEAPEYVPVEIGSGWYLRGDISYAVSTKANGDFEYRTYDSLSGTYGSSQFDSGALESDFGFGGGFGYRFTDMLRADVTADHFKLRFDGATSSGQPCVDPAADPAYAGTTCRSEDLGRATAISVMANGYVDLGTVVGFTPYVGAGAGMTYIAWDELDSNSYCVDGAGTCPGGLAGTSSHASADDWRFTYALMAGVAYDVTPNFKVDLGYRYRHIAGGSMFGWDAASAGATGVQGSDPGFTQHEVKVGLRYELW